MKTIILSLLFLILSIQLRSQGIDTLQSYSEKESGILIESFIEFICLSDSMTMVQFNHYFANDENEFQMEIASDMYTSKYNYTVSDCDRIVEKYRYSNTQELVDYFFEKVKKNFNACNINPHKILKIKDKRTNSYKIPLNSGDEHFYIVVLPSSRSDDFGMWDILNEDFESILTNNSDKYYIDIIKKEYNK